MKTTLNFFRNKLVDFADYLLKRMKTDPDITYDEYKATQKKREELLSLKLPK